MPVWCVSGWEESSSFVTQSVSSLESYPVIYLPHPWKDPSIPGQMGPLCPGPIQSGRDVPHGHFWGCYCSSLWMWLQERTRPHWVSLLASWPLLPTLSSLTSVGSRRGRSYDTLKYKLSSSLWKKASPSSGVPSSHSRVHLRTWINRSVCRSIQVCPQIAETQL